MKKVIWIGIVLMALGATSTAHAQETQLAPRGPSWNLGADIGFKPSISLPTVGTADSKNIDVTKDGSALWTVYIVYAPVGGWGGEVRDKKVVTNGHASASTLGPLVVYGFDGKPNAISSAPIAFNPQNYTDTSSVEFSQVDFLANRTWGLHNGAITFSAGVSYVDGTVKDSNGVTQKIRFYARLPSGAIDPIADDETYTTGSVSSNTLHGWGGTFALNGEKCFRGWLVFEGRAAVTFIPRGNNEATGFFTYTKDVSLVNQSTNAPGQNIVHLNLAPNQSQFSDSTASSVVSTDIKGAIKWRKRIAEHAAFEFGIGVSRVYFDMRQAPAFVSPGPFAVGAGKYQTRTGSFAGFSPMFTSGILF